MSSEWSNIVLIILQAAGAYLASRAHKQALDNHNLIASNHTALTLQQADTLERLNSISDNQLYRN